jgi:hypothetical protein
VKKLMKIKTLTDVTIEKNKITRYTGILFTVQSSSTSITPSLGPLDYSEVIDVAF